LRIQNVCILNFDLGGLKNPPAPPPNSSLSNLEERYMLTQTLHVLWQFLPSNIVRKPSYPVRPMCLVST